MRDADRKSLLLGTALASTLILSSLLAPAPAGAVPCTQPPGTAPINHAAVPAVTPITCVNTTTRIGTNFAIGITTAVDYGYIDLTNSGQLIAVDPGGGANGIITQTLNPGSETYIGNSGDIYATGSSANGIRASADSEDSPITIVNGGALRAIATTSQANGIQVRTADNSSIDITNDGYIYSRSTGAAATGIFAYNAGSGSPIEIINAGDLRVIANALAFGLFVDTDGPNSGIEIVNSGGIIVNSINGFAVGIQAGTGVGDSPLSLVNSGDIAVSAATTAVGISVNAYDNSRLDFINNGGITVSADFAFGIAARTDAGGSPLSLVNNGSVIISDADILAVGIDARTYDDNSRLSLVNNGDITATSTYATGINVSTIGDNNSVSLVNSGGVTVNAVVTARGIDAATEGDNSPLTVVNSGDVRATGLYSYAISTYALFSDATIVNRGTAIAYGRYSYGIYSYAYGATTTVLNSGLVTAESLRAIDSDGGSTLIYNTGLIRGYVDLTDNADTFINQAGGVFETKLVSDFGGGGDLFLNEAGGTVLAATDPNVREMSAFINLERFENRGLISLVDGRVGDRFEISNTVGGEDLTFSASDGSTLAVDAFLGGPGSQADEFVINGNVGGKTALQVNNTNLGPGVNGAVIPVIEVGGNVQPDAFFLSQPIDTGFFQYDLFFRPTGSGVFELRSFVGGGALFLPQLITGAQDIWYQGSSTWFDRTADLRVLLAGGATPIAYNPNGGYADGAAAGPAMTPAVWARGAGAWLDRDATERVTAFGNTYSFDLSRDLDVIDWQMGLDLGTRDLFSSGDILVFGLLGGFVGASLDYDRIARHFDFSGGQIGGYATYLNGGLFVDTLLNAHLLEMETRTFGFANSLDANTLGLRTDAGYRFGSFNGGAFVEPLATIAVLWSDIDGFTNGGNSVAFDDEANVRGRLGLRVGTSYPVWAGTTMEPFVIGSLWGHLSGDNQATLTSTGTTFRFEDDLDDVWGEVSAGLNFFNPSANTAVFAKLDVTFGDDVDGIGGKAGMRVSW